MAHDTFKAMREFSPSPGKTGRYYSLAALEQAGLGKISRLPRSIAVVLTAHYSMCPDRVPTDLRRRAVNAYRRPHLTVFTFISSPSVVTVTAPLRSVR